MSDSYTFAVDVSRTVCGRLEARATDLRLMVETGSSFEEWLNWEAFLACKQRQASYPFCEVTAKPGYASEGVADGSDPDHNLGNLRVGGPNEGANHCWVFAEFVLLHDGNRRGMAAEDRSRHGQVEEVGVEEVRLSTDRGGSEPG